MHEKDTFSIKGGTNKFPKGRWTPIAVHVATNGCDWRDRLEFDIHIVIPNIAGMKNGIDTFKELVNLVGKITVSV